MEESPLFKPRTNMYQRIVEARNLVEDFLFDGEHHKQWLIDQMLRVLLVDEYEEFVTNFSRENYDDWDEGIAP